MKGINHESEQINFFFKNQKKKKNSVKLYLGMHTLLLPYLFTWLDTLTKLYNVPFNTGK